MGTRDTGTRGRTHGLPAERTSFVGRRREIAQIRRMLSAAPVVTLTGPGGVGKTRLASRAAASLEGAFPDGVWMVDLAALRSRELLAPAIVEALGIRDQTARPPLEVLTGHLKDRRLLMILDNCEHLVGECAVVARAVLRSAPDLRIIATSRQSLRVPGERLLEVPPLGLPGDARPSAARLARADAPRLFAERAAAAAPGFAVTEANGDAVVEICRRLDGIPLAIELAAAQLRTLSIERLLAQLEDRFGLLPAPGARPAHHRTLRALIDWSHGLCTEEERLLWSRVSVFAGNLDLEAAEAVCGGDGLAAHDVVDLLSSLVDKSILISRHDGEGVRYRLLETIRDYGLERLEESGQAAALRRRHRDHYRRLASQSRARMTSPEQMSWLARLGADHANLRLALEHCYTEPGQTRTGLAMAADLMYHWVNGVYLGEGRAWLRRGLAVETEPSDVRVRALWTDGVLAIIQADLPSAEADLRECRALADGPGDLMALAYVALGEGLLALGREDAVSAIPLLEEAVRLFRAADDPIGVVEALIRLCVAHRSTGEHALAVSIGEQSLAVCDRHGLGWHKAYTLAVLGVAVCEQGDARHAAALVSEAVRFNRSLRDQRGVGLDLEILAWIATTQGRLRRAARLYGILGTLWARIGDPPPSGYLHSAAHGEQSRSRARHDLGEPAFEAEYARGAELDYEEALAYALDEEEPADPGSADGDDRLPPLTARETQIARLIAQGLSNKEIGRSLMIAQRTAEGHVEHILDKLGLDSRTQVAVWVSKHDPARS
ncbi:LuxR family transcriptional regulator [Nonomuraea roseoviolacea subsp. roseoviolacea]|uniref:ATPase/DNA-binding CsgD family transcriptional regulator n=1 Tax=Nonomuraea roseoviolacea subsp. carminata TaxID=160689 RepID=A0ABT1KBT0_9ACTN|nr:LuxR C-terminal-related transcriptional regulator [Nonomuraea roseoviolacea]MCP2351400.1 putative ATPase/DNA-binding CsgD family transcriptional regulator [Nonomuraea roseoviolacea subsp. carminata]